MSAYLELATKDAEAADWLVAGGNRYAAYHAQQAVEKLTKAVLLAKGIEAGIEHRLEELLKRFPTGTHGRNACTRWRATLHMRPPFDIQRRADAFRTTLVLTRLGEICRHPRADRHGSNRATPQSLSTGEPAAVLS
ncbi:MAG TPA: HEPN domain-containing protein [Kofleriaceae bacterium]|nr:HEPN domain-containing protein [Kofleriaceae bacterium]